MQTSLGALRSLSYICYYSIINFKCFVYEKIFDDGCYGLHNADGSKCTECIW